MTITFIKSILAGVTILLIAGGMTDGDKKTNRNYVDLDIPVMLVLRHIWGSITQFEIKPPSSAAVQSWPYHTFVV